MTIASNITVFVVLCGLERDAVHSAGNQYTRHSPERHFQLASCDARGLVNARLVVFDALPHAFWYHFDIPETKEALELMAKFLMKQLDDRKTFL